MTKNLWYSLIGWYGALAILGAYFLSSLSLASPHSLFIALLNSTGSAGLIVISLQKRALQPAVLNIIWFSIAVIGIIQLVLTQHG